MIDHRHIPPSWYDSWFLLLPFVYWKRYLWSRLAPPTNLINWSKWSDPLFKCSLTLSVGDLSINFKLLWTSPHVTAYVRWWLLLSLCVWCATGACASRDGYNSVGQLLSVDNAGFQFFGAETSPRLLFYHFRYSGTSLLSIVANSSNVCYALSAMDAVLLGRLQFSSNG